MNNITTAEKSLTKSKADIDSFISLRQSFIEKVNSICVEGKDYHIIQGKKSLAKGGAEKIASIFHWTAKFEKDTESLEMLGDTKGVVAFKCTLMNGEFVGEGRGASSVSKNNGDPNKTLKMAQKSAFIDAVLRASGLSDFFTQDLGPEDEGSKYNHLEQTEQTTRKPTVKQAAFIKKLCEEKGVAQSRLVEMAKGKNPSELIDTLIKYQPVAYQNISELPTYQQNEELDRISENIAY